MTQDPNENILEPRKSMADAAYRKTRREAKKPFNFELDPVRREELRQVAYARAISMGAVLRQLVSAAYAMDVALHPTCVSGRLCYMPHLHPNPTTTPASAPTPPPQPPPTEGCSP